MFIHAREIIKFLKVLHDNPLPNCPTEEETLYLGTLLLKSLDVDAFRGQSEEESIDILKNSILHLGSGLYKNDNPDKYRKLDDVLFKEAMNFYKSGFPVTEIAKRYGVKPMAIYSRMRRGF